MNLIRLIKLKKINGELDDLTEQESYFLFFFNNLSKHNDNYCLGDNVYFYLDLENKNFYYSYSRIWLVFKSKYDISILEFNDLICGLLETHLNLSGITIIASLLIFTWVLETHLNLSGITIVY